MKIKKLVAVGLALGAVCAWGAAAEESRMYLGACPSVTGNGEQFVFEWCECIWLAPTKGGTARCISGADAKCARPVVSSDGRRVVFNSNRDGCGNHLYELDLATGAARKLSVNSEPTNPCAWGVGGTNRLCVISRDHAGKHSWRIANLATTAAGTMPQLLFDLEGFNPSLSPDGAQLLFSRRGGKGYRKRRHSVDPNAGQIWRYDLKRKTFEPLVCEKTEVKSANSRKSAASSFTEDMIK